MKKGYDLGDEPMLSGKDVKDTKMLDVTARESADIQSGSSNLKKDFKSTMKFGKLGSRGYGLNGK